MIQSAAYYLQKIKTRYIVFRVSELAMHALASATFGLAISFLWPPDLALQIILPVTAFVATAIILSLKFELYQFNLRRVTRFINHRYPQLEESADLLLMDPKELTGLQQLQRAIVEERFFRDYPSINVPHRLRRAAVILALSGLTLVVMSFAGREFSRMDSPLRIAAAADSELPQKEIPAAIKNIDITITPPKYTGIKTYSVQHPQLEIPEGALISWRIDFTDSVKQASLIFSSGKYEMKKGERQEYFTQRRFSEPEFYQIGWSDGRQMTTSDFYRIAVIRDEPPVIKVKQLAQFTQLSIDDKLAVDISCQLSDDYGLSDGYIIATVSKGSGESVKFREEKLPFNRPKTIEGKSLSASRVLDLRALGLEPGDELYFYVEAWDVKYPNPNRSRTETFFISLKDTASHIVSVDGGLGVDLMPVYFRSQRQIIIDSEKLLREKKSITRDEFNARSNELGYDQKVLRLKYGEFLGEEFESAIGPGQTVPVEEEIHADGEEEQDPTAEYSHIHDKDNEHNLVPEKKPATNHNHDAERDPEKEDDPSDAYKHIHDDPEEATFFTQTIRAKLKAALSVMWDAELHLRLFDPSRSLPYQYEALRLLKEISNDSRIYVHKTGFDPPPLKEEKRLTGDLTEIKSTRLETNAAAADLFPAIRDALTIIEARLQNPRQLTEAERSILTRAGRELAPLALEQPGMYLTSLSQINTLTQNEVDREELADILFSLRSSLWKAVPNETPNATQTQRTRHALNRTFIENLEGLEKK